MRAAALALLVIAGCAHDPATALPTHRVAARFIDNEGRPVSLAGLRGQIVLVQVMTTWSDPALMELPGFADLAVKYAEDFQVVIVTLDEDPRMRAMFATAFDMPFLFLGVEEPRRFSGPDGPLGEIGVLPTSFLLDRDGRVAARSVGTWPAGSLSEAIRRLIDR